MKVMVEIHIFIDSSDHLSSLRQYLGLNVGDLDELNGCLKKLGGEFVLKRSTVEILSLDGNNRGPLNLKKDQGLP